MYGFRVRVRARARVTCFFETLGVGVDMYNFREWTSLGIERGSLRIPSARPWLARGGGVMHDLYPPLHIWSDSV